MIDGSCLCGAVRFEIEGPPERMNICHCSMCRKVTGSAFGVFAHIRSLKFHWVSEVGTLVEYGSSPDHIRAFCSNCGSSVPNVGTDYTCIPAGLLDSDPRVKPMLQIFTKSRAHWYDIPPDPPAYEEFDPD